MDFQLALAAYLLPQCGRAGAADASTRVFDCSRTTSYKKFKTEEPAVTKSYFLVPTWKTQVSPFFLTRFLLYNTFFASKSFVKRIASSLNSLSADACAGWLEIFVGERKKKFKLKVLPLAKWYKKSELKLNKSLREVSESVRRQFWLRNQDVSTVSTRLRSRSPFKANLSSRNFNLKPVAKKCGSGGVRRDLKPKPKTILIRQELSHKPPHKALAKLEAYVRPARFKTFCNSVSKKHLTTPDVSSKTSYKTLLNQETFLRHVNFKRAAVLSNVSQTQIISFFQECIAKLSDKTLKKLEAVVKLVAVISKVAQTQIISFFQECIAKLSYKTLKKLEAVAKLVVKLVNLEIVAVATSFVSKAKLILSQEVAVKEALTKTSALAPTSPANIFFRTQHERASRDRITRSGDVETNPGPATGPANLDHDDARKQNEATVRVTSYNVRGLNDEKKLRHLINKIYKEDKGKNYDSFVCLQETYISNPGKIPYLWRGNFYLTPGTGSSSGCLTLLSPHLSVVHSKNIDNRAHVIACQKSGDNSVSFIIANIYAPNPNNADKIAFFDQVFESVLEFSERFESAHIIMAGDYNLIFCATEAKNRQYSPQERRVADYVKERVETLALADCWTGRGAFTWRRPNTDIFSTIDRVLFSPGSIELASVRANWSYSFSDHAAVIACFKLKAKDKLQRSKITRLDPSLAKSIHYKNLIEQGFNALIETIPPDWNPHLKLEFAKMSIRTVVEKIQAERKRAELSEEDNINEELDTVIEQLARGINGGEQDLIDYVEELRARKQVLIEERGARLAEKLGTKWFNEGEKSSRYFMRLLNRALPDNFELLQGENGEIITEPKDIEKEIVDFYKKLYEDVNIVVEDDQDFFNHIESISDEDDAAIAAPLEMGDLKMTLDSCSDSAPGPDGIPYSYILLLWPVFGRLLCEAWKYSLERKCLPPSHKSSFLKLIPKAGKDKTKLTNWRPITLSNCDHKLITKTYARKLSEKVASKICGNQTAYLKNRLINDNIRSILSTITLTNLEEVEGLIVSLDAKKAFDSVDHGYIEKCLKKFGCHSFVPIFRTLYKDLNTDIIINGKIVQGFKIKRGVKQGDALSCILYIMCMEPLIRNIIENPNIKAVNSTILSCDLPKVYAYADDVNCVMLDEESSLKELFKEYEKLTLASGLELNAEKTEIMRLCREEGRTYTVEYKEAEHEIRTLN